MHFYVSIIILHRDEYVKKLGKALS